MLDALDRQTRLTSHQARLIILATFAVCLEFLDIFLIAFILTFVSQPWSLTFGMSSVILLSSGVGTIFGAMFFGHLADRIGRRRVFLLTIGTFTVGTAALALTPESPEFGWLYLTFFRVLVGFGAGGLYVVDLPLVQEFMPVAKRGWITGFVTAAVPLGFLVGSLLTWLVAPLVGWRGVLVVCVALSLLVFVMRWWIPESPRWLLRRGEVDKARESVAWALRVDPEQLPADAPELSDEAREKPRFTALLRYPRSLVVSCVSNLGTQTGYYGLTLWTPTLLVQVLHLRPEQSGFLMVFVTLGALAGRVSLSWLSERLGRRGTGTLCGAAAAVVLVFAALSGDVLLGGVSVFFLLMIVAYFFGEGGFAIVGPYSAEVWPSALRTTGMGFAYGLGGIGKVIGPLGLALILGSSNLVRPEASTHDLLPAFCYFGAWYLLSAVMFVTLGFETKGRSLERLEREIESQRREVADPVP